MSTVDRKEIIHFKKDSQKWWDEKGPFAPLHKLNPVRLEFIFGEIDKHFNLAPSSSHRYKDLNVLDIGCGGGLVAEPFARLGAKVTGCDADDEAIEVARQHAQNQNLGITYENKAVEDLPSSSKYDVITALEIIEHVKDPELFLESCIGRLSPGGILFVSTLNRTKKSYLLGKVAAEYILNWVPKGTHDWNKFFKPSEIAKILRTYGLSTNSINGIIYNPLRNKFELSSKDLNVNYIISAKRL
ncbi:MAG: bifunctional 3-demethylubiquinol 3-O-methyltransferase/2-polyprenyl-6-hydroxyphenol methylase [Micavibrio sp.]|nr:bifunctional 3-demethylubiquinol 3-O-methyltransferase/2-polyprenyl-6-hydroxyphenol methylase [Micavibrio sp.]